MKNISLLLNVVLIIAVAILYFLHFKGKEENVASDSSTPIAVLPLHNSGIVFINSDSLLEKYDFYKNEKSKFELSQSRIKSELKNQSDRLQQEVELYQQQAIGMTDAQRAKKEEELTMKQQQLMQKKDELVSRLDEEQGKSSEALYTRLNQYLKKYNKGKNYQYVLGFQKGGGILFANDSLNITGEVLKGLNEEYAEGAK